MKTTKGSQQSDSWIRNRVGRITGSRMKDVCDYLSRASNGKKAGDSSAKRDGYKWELIGERLSGRAEDHYVTPAMSDGIQWEEEARICYERALNVMCEPVSFILHPDYDFTGSSPDALIDNDGVLEIKCPTRSVHLGYIDKKTIPEEYIPQIAWELACTGRRYADFVSYNPLLMDEKARFFYRRVGRDELAWIIDEFSVVVDKKGEEKLTAKERVLTGEEVIEYFTSQTLTLHAEVNNWIGKQGFKTIAPFPVEIIEEPEAIEGDVHDFNTWSIGEELVP